MNTPTPVEDTFTVDPKPEPVKRKRKPRTKPVVDTAVLKEQLRQEILKEMRMPPPEPLTRHVSARAPTRSAGAPPLPNRNKIMGLV